MSQEPVESYLDELYARLRTDPRSARRLLDEAADHLHAATADYQAAGLDRVSAERAAVERFGPSEPLVRADRTFGRLLLDTAFGCALLGGIGLVAVGVSGVLAGLMSALFGTRFVGGGLAGSIFGGPPRSVAVDAGDAVALRALAGLVGVLVLAAVWLARRRGVRMRVLPVSYVDTTGLVAFAAATLALGALSIDQVVQHAGHGTGFFLSGALVSLAGATVFGVRAVRGVLA
ncbi:MAG TPA: permease prefix domain 1-containing protein [Jatrophihabitans sp.]|jgi:hypothetical protein